MATRAKITIEDVAKAAGVSRQTVSRVINKGLNVKPAVREKVEQAIAELDYVPSLSARRMASGKSYLIMAVNDRQRTLENWQAGRGNDWVDQMLYGGMTECERQGYRLVFELISTEPDKARNQLSNSLAALRPDGIILTPPHSDNDALAAMLAERGIPCARIGRRQGKHSIDVFMNEAGAAAEAAQLLLSQGRRKLAFIAGSPEYGNSQKRVEGFLQALDDAGVGQENGIVAKANFQFEPAVEVLEDMLASADRPTGIIADNDEMAFAAMHVASKLGLAVPEDLAVISFEDTPGVRFSVPPLTAIRQPTSDMIGRACEQLIASSKGEAANGSFELPYRLVVRDTTGPLATGSKKGG